LRGVDLPQNIETWITKKAAGSLSPALHNEGIAQEGPMGYPKNVCQNKAQKIIHIPTRSLSAAELPCRNPSKQRTYRLLVKLRAARRTFGNAMLAPTPVDISLPLAYKTFLVTSMLCRAPFVNGLSIDKRTHEPIQSELGDSVLR